MTEKKNIFMAGGELPTDHPTYIEREVDREAYRAAKRFDLLHIIAPNFMGKTSLINRLIHLLEEEGWLCAYVNMSLMKNFSNEDWYNALGRELARFLTPEKNH